MKGVFILNCTRLFHMLLLGMLCSAASAAITASASVRAHNPETRISYIAVTITNPMSVPANCRLEFMSYGYRSEQHEAVVNVPTIPPGESRTVNVAIPLQNVNNGMLVEENGDRTALAVSTHSYGSPNYLGYIHAAEPANLLTDPQLDNFTYRLHPDAGGYGYGSHSGTTRTLTTADRNICQAEVDTLPENWLCYVPVKALFISDSAERRLTSPQRDAIDTWLSMGGTMMVYGSSENTTTTVAGGGSIIRVNENPVLDADYMPYTHVQPFAVGRDIASTGTPYRENRAGGRNGAFFLATLFLIIVGPVNYFYFARRQQIRMLIVTVPVISLAFCSVIAVYFVLTQGFNRKGGSVSVTRLDEDSNRAITFARHSLLTGLYPLGGFKFGPETYFLADTGSEERSGADFDLTRGTVLRGGLFQPGIPFNYTTVTPYTTRERMLFDADKGELRNGFELPAKAVAVLSGDQYFQGGAASPGATAKLTAVDAAESAALLSSTPSLGQYDQTPNLAVAKLVALVGKNLSQAEMDSAVNMAVRVTGGTEETSAPLYAVLFEGIPKTSESGVEISEGKNLHLLIGRASTAGEDGR